jgi:cyclase
MKTIRVIPALDIKDGRLVTGVNFVNLRDVGDPVECARAYEQAGADELCLLDIMASHEGRGTTVGIVEQITKAITIPLAVAGGVRSVEDVERLLEAGASKVGMTSPAVRRPELINEAVARFGSQRIIGTVDAKRTSGNSWEVYINGGRIATGVDAVAFLVDAVARGVGELLINSLDTDGAKTGYDLELLRAVSSRVDVPVIASSGAGRLEHFYEAVVQGGASAVLAATLFHFGKVTVPQVKDYLRARGVNVRL